MSSNGTADLVTVRLRRIPLAVYAHSTQHWEELMREFALISLDSERQRSVSDNARPVPIRLLELVDELTKNFSSFTSAQEAERDAALARGDAELDLTYQLPATVVDASRRLDAILDEVDGFCRSGQHLITLATPPESLAFRKWYLSEFVRQIEERSDPVPWPHYVAEHHQAEAWTVR